MAPDSRYTSAARFAWSPVSHLSGAIWAFIRVRVDLSAPRSRSLFSGETLSESDLDRWSLADNRIRQPASGGSARTSTPRAEGGSSKHPFVGIASGAFIRPPFVSLDVAVAIARAAVVVGVVVSAVVLRNAAMVVMVMAVSSRRGRHCTGGQDPHYGEDHRDSGLHR
jgi:hypothetical protein